MGIVLRLLTLALLLPGFGAFAHADFVVVVNKSQNIESLNRVDIQNIYLSKTGSFPNGSWVIPVDQKKGTAQRAAFYESVLQRTEAQLKSYFSRLVFTGKGTPPRLLDNDESVLQQVRANESVLGYVMADSVDDTVKVIYRFSGSH